MWNNPRPIAKSPFGIPAVIGVVAGWQWWKRLPDEEKKEYHFGKRARTARGGDGVSVFFFVAFAIKVMLTETGTSPSQRGH